MAEPSYQPAALSPEELAALQKIQAAQLPSAQALSQRFQTATAGFGAPRLIPFGPSALPTQEAAAAGIGQFTAPIRAPGAIAPLQAPAQIQPFQGLSPEYYQQVSQQASERLRRQFFEPGGVQQQIQEGITSRGLVGSGVEQELLRQGVFQPFARGAQDIQAQLASQQLQEQAEARKFDIGIQLQQAAQQIDVGKFNAGLQQHAQELGVSVERLNRDLGLEGQQMLLNLAISREGTENQKAIAQSQLDTTMESLRSQVVLAEQGMLNDLDLRNLDLELKKAETALNVAGRQQERGLQEAQFGLQGRQFGLQESQQKAQSSAALAALMSDPGFLDLPQATQESVLRGFGDQGQEVIKRMGTITGPSSGQPVSLSGSLERDEDLKLVEAIKTGRTYQRQAPYGGYQTINGDTGQAIPEDAMVRARKIMMGL